MVDLFSLEDAHKFNDAWPTQARLRYKIFIQKQGYDVPSYNSMEYDTYDTPAARYMLWKDRSGAARACMRLIPTNERYMLRELWPELTTGAELPTTSSVWEISRFGIDSEVSGEARKEAVAEMMCGLAEFAEKFNVKEFLFVSSANFIKRLVGDVSAVEALGKVQRLGKFTVCAARVTVPENVVKKMQDRYKVQQRVLTCASDEPAVISLSLSEKPEE